MKSRAICRTAVVAAAAASLIVGPSLVTASGAVANGASSHATAHQTPSEIAHSSTALRGPARPLSTHPKVRSGYVAPTASSSVLADAGASSTFESAAAPASARTWGPAGATTSTLVLYDTTNTYGWLGELYAMAAGNLASHFGRITAEPVVDYQAGQLNDFSAAIYLGSTYNEPIPVSFLNDVLATTKPVVWAGLQRLAARRDRPGGAGLPEQVRLGCLDVVLRRRRLRHAGPLQRPDPDAQRRRRIGSRAPHHVDHRAGHGARPGAVRHGRRAGGVCADRADAAGFDHVPVGDQVGEPHLHRRDPAVVHERDRPLSRVLRSAVLRPAARGAHGSPGAGAARGRQPGHQHAAGAAGDRRLPVERERAVQRRRHPRLRRSQRVLQRRDPRT